MCVIMSSHLQLLLHRSWSISQSLEHLEGISGMPNPVPSRMHPSNLGPVRSSPVAGNQPTAQRPNGTPQYIAGWPNHTVVDSLNSQEMPAHDDEVQQQPSSPFANNDASSLSFNLRQMVGQEQQLHHDGSLQDGHQHGNHHQHVRSPLGFQKSSPGHASVNAPLELIPERSERNSAMSIEFAGQGYAPSQLDAQKGRANGADNLLHHPPSMQWQQ